MRRLTYLIAMTVDGFIAAPDRSDPTGPDGFWPLPEDYIAHLVAEFPETLPAAARNALGVTATGGAFDTALMGRRTYEIGLAAGVTNAYPHLRSLVFSHTLAGSLDPSVEVVAGDPVERVRALKDEPGSGLWLVGGGSLAGALYDEIDELVLKIAPITIGAGVPLFGDTDTSFRLQGWIPQAASTLRSGVSILSLRRPD
ncbi:dihydrofolate reductase family protein [Pseudonocardia charpentierae]|uniref:Dihydrofolate reductase family protein n=1 Tax=Pseudonocardia charpentierae TaxID=3075545 RepID=A0ABU2NJ36_9PSEU|nr:dihydrofolate reductase family protein [Pseudonocardia sp. DSM 45834]MDT0352629.1 dihydrofolate reductase family protein [Pseudonocardia sp. DSM 45834]